MTGKRARVAVGFAVAAALALSPAAPARAVDVATLAQIAKGAYEAYQMFFAKKQLTVEEATQRIVGAIDSSKAEILSRITSLQVSEVKACTTSTLVSGVDLGRMTKTAQQQFAASSVDCVAKAVQALQDLSDKAQVDQLGFALNSMGPVALMARVRSGLTTTALQNLITQGNNLVVATLTPRCRVETQAEFDGRGKPIPDQAQHTITCEVYGTHRGVDHAEGRIPNGGLDTTKARDLATRTTSYPIAVASLAALGS